MENPNFNPIWVFCASFLVSALAGLAALLRSTNALTKISIISSFLNSGLLGLGICLLWYTRFEDNIYFLVGICVLAGLGGMTTIDFVLSAIRKGGFTISLNKDGATKFGPSEDTKP